MAEPVRQSSFHREVAGRFGIVPNFFTSSSDAPEVMEKLWEFAKSAYLDSPIPPLFKERLFVFLSRFCEVRYCIVRHCGFLVGHGHVAGDSAAPPHTVAQAIKLLKMPTPWRRPIEAVYQGLEEIEHVPTDWPEPDSDVEGDLCHADPVGARPARIAKGPGAKRFEQLLAYFAFIRTAHYWTVVHPGLTIEDDVRELMSTNKELAALLLQDPDTVNQS